METKRIIKGEEPFALLMYYIEFLGKRSANYDVLYIEHERVMSRTLTVAQAQFIKTRRGVSKVMATNDGAVWEYKSFKQHCLTNNYN